MLWQPWETNIAAGINFLNDNVLFDKVIIKAALESPLKMTDFIPITLTLTTNIHIFGKKTIFKMPLIYPSVCHLEQIPLLHFHQHALQGERALVLNTLKLVEPNKNIQCPTRIF